MRYTLPGKQHNQHAVVIGAGLEGLLAARVLAEQFALVTMIAQDKLPQTSSLPGSIWQAIPQHILSLQGQRDLERLFPGMKAELMAAGAPGIDWMADVPVLLPGGWGPRFHSDLTTRSATIHLLEQLIQRRLLEYSRGCVEFLEAQPVEGIFPGGVLLSTGLLQADVIVDASGRGSQASDWLVQAGCDRPEQTRISSQMSLAARLVRRPHGLNPGWRGLIMLPDTQRRGGVLLPVEEGCWLVMLTGDDDAPPDDDAGFLSFASDLSPLGEALKVALPLTPVFTTQDTDSQFWHYDRIASWPDHFLVTGAVVYNPAFGLDLTVSTLAAFTLRETLIDQRKRYPEGELKGLGARYQKRLARAHGSLWQIMPLHESGWVTRLGRWYRERLLAEAVHDPRIYQTVIETVGLMTPVNRLFRPVFVRRLLTGRAPSNLSAVGPPVLQTDQPHKTITQEVMSVATHKD